MIDEPLDLPRAIRAIGRRRVPLLGLFIAGIWCGLVVTALQEPTFVARSRILLPPARTDAQGREVRDMKTQIHIATSADVLERARTAVNAPTAANHLRRQIRVRGVSADILEVRAEAGTPFDAVLLADAVANAYVAHVNGGTSAVAESAITVLEQYAADLNLRIQQLQRDIASANAGSARLDPRSAEGLRLTALVSDLRGEEVDVARELNAINAQIADARLSAEVSRRSTRVLERASRPDRPSRPQPLTNLGVGGFAGLMAGSMLALALEQGDRRLRNRDSIAEAAGAPVLASMRVPPLTSIKKARRFVQGWTPSVVETLALEQALTRLGVVDEDPPVNVVAVALPGDRVAPILAFQLATFAATVGIRTVFVMATHHPSSSLLRSALLPRGSDERLLRPNLWVRDVSDVESEDVRMADLSVALVVAESGPLVLPTWYRRTLVSLAVTSGFATAEDLAAASGACVEAGHRMRGVFVANPDPSDRTTGRLGFASVVTTNAHVRADGNGAHPNEGVPPLPDERSNGRGHSTTGEKADLPKSIDETGHRQ